MVFRIGGLATGMDTDSLVKQMLQAYQTPIDKVKQQKQLIEWKRDDYRAVNTKVLAFRDAAFDMKLKGAYTTKKAESENEQAVKVSATNQAIEGVYTIKVKELATSATVTSSAIGKKNNQAKMSELGITEATSITLSGDKGSVTVMIKPTDTITDVMGNINNKTRLTGVNASYDASLDRFYFTNPATGEAAKFELKSTNADLLGNVFKLSGSAVSTVKGETITTTAKFDSVLLPVISAELTKDKSIDTQFFRITRDGKDYDFSIKADTSIGNLIDQINGSGLGKSGVSAYLSGDGKLAFFNADQSKQLEFAEVSESTTQDEIKILEQLGLQNASGTNVFTTTSDQEYTKLETKGKDAVIEYNGVEAKYATNSFVVNGLNVTAKKVTSDAVSVSISGDTDAIYDKIKSFVDKYNTLVDDITVKTSETRDRDYTPLTDAQKEAMSEEQIKAWETKAKSGMLRRDDVLRNALSSFRNSLSSVVGGMSGSELKQLTQIGITTGSSYTENGKLTINEETLRKAIAERPEEVAAMFTVDDSNANTDAGDGFAVRLHQKATELIDKLKSIAGTTDMTYSQYDEGKLLNDLDERIERLKDRMEDAEDRYYAQFTAMERYINQLNQQSNWLAQQLGGSTQSS
jgi:flagellar hook-associated protein 2